MTDLVVVYRNPADLKPYDRNSRTHTPEQINLIRASIREYGFTNPILLKDDLTIGAGHARQQAALAECIEAVPTITLASLTDAQWRAYVIADNQLAMAGSGWDDEILRTEIERLMSEEYDISLIGFTESELHAIMEKGSGATDPEDVPPLPADPVSMLGDIWIMGDHRLICGSSTDPEDVAAVLAGAKPHLMVTDPPYGVEYDPAWRGKAKSNDGKRTSLGVHAVGEVLNDDRADWTEAWDLFDGDVAYVWHGGIASGIVAENLTSSGFSLRTQIIWNKNNIAIGRGDYHWKHEPCWHAVRKGKTGHWQGSRKEATVWDIDKPMKSETGHGTQKPVECMKRPIENNSAHGDLVYDPFSGSGTTIIAGQITGRKVIAIELNPAYVDVAVMRWEAFAKAEATLEASGQTFAEVRAERLG